MFLTRSCRWYYSAFYWSALRVVPTQVVLFSMFALFCFQFSTMIRLFGFRQHMHLQVHWQAFVRQDQFWVPHYWSHSVPRSELDWRTRRRLACSWIVVPHFAGNWSNLNFRNHPTALTAWTIFLYPLAFRWNFSYALLRACEWRLIGADTSIGVFIHRPNCSFFLAHTFTNLVNLFFISRQPCT